MHTINNAAKLYFTQHTLHNRFLFAYCLVAAIAIYQCISAVLVASQPLSQSARGTLAVGCLLLVALVTLLPLRTGGLTAVFGHEHRAGDDDDGVGSDGGGARGPGGGLADRERALAGVDSASGSPRVARRVGGGARDARSGASVTGGSKGGLDGEELGDSERLPLLLGAAVGGSAAEGAVSAGGGSAAALPLTLGRAAAASGSAAANGSSSSALPSVTTAQMLTMADFWFIFLQFGVGTGVALALLNNLGQLVIALGGEPGGQVVIVSLFSVANAAGRLLMGYAPEHFLHSRGTPRVAFLLLVAVGMVRELAGGECVLGTTPPAVVGGVPNPNSVNATQLLMNPPKHPPPSPSGGHVLRRRLLHPGRPLPRHRVPGPAVWRPVEPHPGDLLRPVWAGALWVQLHDDAGGRRMDAL